MPNNLPNFHANRALRAEHTLEYYKLRLGEHGPVDADTIRDLLQDTLHWLAMQQPPNDYPEPLDTLRTACEDACTDFPLELKESPDVPLDPDGFRFPDDDPMCKPERDA